jgi:hypothetical protein
LDETCRTHGRRKKSYKFIIGNLGGKRLLGKPGRRWGDTTSIKINHNEVGCNDMDWIYDSEWVLSTVVNEFWDSKARVS